MVREEFRLGEVIVKAGVYQKWMYSICQGAVDIYSEYGTANEKKLVTLTEGQFFGEIGMIAVMPRTATAVAAAETVVLEQISNEDFEEYLNNHPESLQPIMSSVSKRIRELTEDMSGITQMTNALLGTQEKDTGWLADAFGKLLGKLKEKKASRDEFEVQTKRQMALASEKSTRVRFSAGTVIFREGDVADCMYDICDGYVGIYSDYQTEDEKLLTKLNVEEVFGEMGILDDMPRSATAVCLTDCILLVVKPENFMQFFQEKPAKILDILQQMCIRLRNLTNTYLQVCKTLEELDMAGAKTVREDETLAKLEHMRQTHLSEIMYDTHYSWEWMY